MHINGGRATLRQLRPDEDEPFDELEDDYTHATCQSFPEILRRLRNTKEGRSKDRVARVVVRGKGLIGLNEPSRVAAEALWVEDDVHAGLGTLRLSPAVLMDMTVALYVRKTLTSDWRRHTDSQLNKLYTWLRSYGTETLTKRRDYFHTVHPSGESRDHLRPFATMCRERGFTELAVYVALITGDMILLRELVRLGPGVSQDVQYSSRLMKLLMIRAGRAITNDIFIHHFGLGGLRCLKFNFDMFNDYELIFLANQCVDSNLEGWAVAFQVYFDEKRHLVADLDAESLSFALLFGAEYGRWSVVRDTLPLWWQDRDVLVLHRVFAQAAKFGEVSFVRRLLPEINLQGLRRVLDCPAPAHQLLEWAVNHFAPRRAEELTTLLCREGLATHVEQVAAADLFFDALSRKRVKLCKILHQLGVVSVPVGRDVCVSERVRDLAISDPALQPAVDLVSAFLDPRPAVRTLQDLCRLKVSHLLEFGGDREGRIKTLGATEPAQDLLRFQDPGSRIK